MEKLLGQKPSKANWDEEKKWKDIATKPERSVEFAKAWKWEKTSAGRRKTRV